MEPIFLNWLYKLKNLRRLMHNCFAKDHNKIICTVNDLIYSWKPLTAHEQQLCKKSEHNQMHSLQLNLFLVFFCGATYRSFQPRNLRQLVRNNFAKDHNMIKLIVYDSISYTQTNIYEFLIFTSCEWLSRSLLLNSLFLSKIFIFGQKWAVKNLMTSSV